MTIDELKSKGRIIAKSSIDGAFDGFDEEALFPLHNGQCWIQHTYRYWYYCASGEVGITIYLYNGAYYLTVDGQAEWVEVEPLMDAQVMTIVNAFTGRNGKTIFEMDNGQVWQQDAYADHDDYADSPTAFLYHTGWEYKMRVNGATVPVKRIK